MTRIFLVLFVISCLFYAGCPKKSDAKKTAELSFQFSGLVLDLAKATEKAFAANLLTVAQKDVGVALIRGMNAGAKQFNAIARELAEAGDSPPADKLEILNRILSNELITPFLEILKLFTGVDVPYVREAINAIRIAILTISGTLSEFGAEPDGRIVYA